MNAKGQLGGNSMEEQTLTIKSRYADAKIIVESYSGAKERPLFNKLIKEMTARITQLYTHPDRQAKVNAIGVL